MSEAQYMPANTDFAGSFFNAANGAQSFMQRAQRMKIEKQQADEEAQNLDYQKGIRTELAPVLAAKNQADIATAKATLASAQQVQQLKAQLGTALPAAQQEYHDAMKIANFGEQAQALSELHQKYSWMSLLPEGKDFVNHISTQQVQANQSFLLDQHFQQQRDMAQETFNREMDVTKEKNKGALEREAVQQAGITQRAGPLKNPRVAAMKEELDTKLKVLQEKLKTEGALTPEDAQKEWNSIYALSHSMAQEMTGGAQRELSAQEQQAKAWADANPNDPRADAIRKKLGL